MVKYQFEIDDDDWKRWKETVPRSKSLEKRIIELIRADAEGRVRASDDESERERPSPPADPGVSQAPVESDTDALDSLTFPSGVDHADGVEAILAARDYLRESGPASARQIVLSVGAEHPLKYDIPESLESGERYRGAWWRRVVKPGLKALDDVEPPATGESEWRSTGGADE